MILSLRMVRRKGTQISSAGMEGAVMASASTETAHSATSHTNNIHDANSGVPVCRSTLFQTQAETLLDEVAKRVRVLSNNRASDVRAYVLRVCTQWVERTFETTKCMPKTRFKGETLYNIIDAHGPIEGGDIKSRTLAALTPARDGSNYRKRSVKRSRDQATLTPPVTTSTREVDVDSSHAMFLWRVLPSTHKIYCRANLRVAPVYTMSPMSVPDPSTGDMGS
jgi:hypothetical protein